MSDYSRKLKQRLKVSGCYFERQGKGDHEIWYSPITRIRFVVDNSIRSRHTANAVLKIVTRGACAEQSAIKSLSPECRVPCPGYLKNLNLKI